VRIFPIAPEEILKNIDKLNVQFMISITPKYVMNTSSSPRVWFITGTSRGLGAIIAKSALEAGDIVIGTGRKAEDVTRALGTSDRVLALSLDVTKPESAAAAVKESMARFGKIDVLINNAGFGVLGGVEETSAEETESVYRTNVFGLLNVTRGVLPHMRAARSGHIINFSSIGGYQSFAGWGVYCSTKFAVEGITEALASELAPLNIHATVVEPGFFRTDFLDAKSLLTAKNSIADYSDTVGAMRSFAEGHSHQQPNDPEKLGPAILKLVNAKNPPVRLPLGRDTIEAIEKKNAQVAKELAEWREVAESTSF
jgi:NAD(P)-dependent dehydrogenase (short-subunit alcohol dehydrogenase family)